MAGPAHCCWLAVVCDPSHLKQPVPGECVCVITTAYAITSVGNCYLSITFAQAEGMLSTFGTSWLK